MFLNCSSRQPMQMRMGPFYNFVKSMVNLIESGLTFICWTFQALFTGDYINLIEKVGRQKNISTWKSNRTDQTQRTITSETARHPFLHNLCMNLNQTSATSTSWQSKSQHKVCYTKDHWLLILFSLFIPSSSMYQSFWLCHFNIW